MRVLILSLIFILLAGCSSPKVDNARYPSSRGSSPCREGIQLFFEENTRRELGHFSEEALFDLGVLKPADLDLVTDDVVFKALVLSEDEHLRGETIKVIALIKKRHPDFTPSKVTDLYHELFHSCRL